MSDPPESWASGDEPDPRAFDDESDSPSGVVETTLHVLRVLGASILYLIGSMIVFLVPIFLAVYVVTRFSPSGYTVFNGVIAFLVWQISLIVALLAFYNLPTLLSRWVNVPDVFER